MVQSLGISIGNANSYVAAGQRGGIEILLNEFSNRSTPSMVAFNDQFRSIGVEAASNLFMNYKNTIYDIILLLGKPYKDLVLQDANGRPYHSFKIEEGPDGQALVVVRHLDQVKKYTITQILAMLFTKLKGIAGDATSCVISFPQFFVDDQKAALCQAALIAGLNPLKAISDMSAVVINYAYYRTTRVDPDKLIAFVNFGQSNLQVVVAWLTPKEDVARILATESEPIGGRDFDLILADHFIRECKLNLSPKSHLKLVFACEKLKRQLSANTNQIPIHVESLISEDQDFTSSMNRATFEDLGHPLFARVEKCLKRALENSKATYDKMVAEVVAEAAKKEAAKKEAAKKAAAQKAQKETAQKEVASKEDKAADEKGGDTEIAPETSEAADNSTSINNNSNSKETAMEVEQKAENNTVPKLDSTNEGFCGPVEVEMVGGSTRIPAIRQLVQNVFKSTPSTTLNTDESVARGCVLHCATLHPGILVKREVKVLGTNCFYVPKKLTVADEKLRAEEIELILNDRKYALRNEARNNLEEYIYLEKSKQNDEGRLQELLSTLDWLSHDENAELSEEVYIQKLAELKKAVEPPKQQQQAKEPGQPADESHKQETQSDESKNPGDANPNAEVKPED